MAIQPNLPNPSFAETSGYDSDENETIESSSTTSSSASGVILGFDDGAIDNGNDAGDEADLTVSRIGGRAYFPLPQSELPPASLLQCPICSLPMRLLTQIYAPLSDDKLRPLSAPFPRNAYRDEFDRLLYTYGCVKKGCLGVRLLRAARRSDSYAKAGREKRTLLAAERAKKEQTKAEERAINPFASGSAKTNPFASNSSSGASVDFGSMIFGGEDSKSTPTEVVASAKVAEKSGLLPASNPAATPSSLWSSDAASFKARYLTTTSEHLSPNFASKGKQGQLVQKLAEMSMSQADFDDPKEPHKGGRTAKSGAGSSSSSGDGWSAEAYEVMRLSGVEEVFLAFQERLEASDAQEQVVRYEFRGTPLPFQAKSTPYQRLFGNSAGPAPGTVVGRSAHAVSGSTDVRRYDEACSKVDKCPHCQSRRTFEMQLMPNLVNILEAQLDMKAGEELGWATVWCFTCSADCLDAKEDSQEGLDWQGWREEVAMIELED